MNIYLEIFVRTLLAVATLIVISRIVGARQISQLTFHDYVAGITIGSIAGTLCVDPDIDMWVSVLAIVIFCAITFIISWITSKSIVLRRILTGSSHIIIDNGKFIEKELKMLRYDVNDVMRELRAQGYFSVSEIKYAILETNGQLSVMTFAAYRPATNEDLKIQAEESFLEANVVIDGKVMERNLTAAGKKKDWLERELTRQNTKLDDVLLATLDREGTLTVFEKGETCEHETIFE